MRSQIKSRPGRLASIVARAVPLAMLAALQLATHSACAVEKVGTPVDAAALAAWNIDVTPDGKGLPAGAGDVAAGRQVFAAHCAACHGAQGQGGAGDPLVGGMGSLQSAHPKKTVGSYWPYATTLFDYIRRAMPYDAPQSLSADEVYAVCAYVLFANGVVPENTRLDARSLPRVVMPNRDGFVRDTRNGNGHL